MIYFIACPEANAVKIGFTVNDPYRRLCTTQSGCPLRLELLAVQPGYLEDEKALLQRFGAQRIHGEWFRLTDEIGAHIAQFSKPEPRARRSYTLRNREPRWAA